MSTEITITIGTDGATKVAVKGVKGRGCKALTAEFEKGLGKVTSDENSKEFYEEQQTQIKARG